jgi:hypothetical protein
VDIGLYAEAAQNGIEALEGLEHDHNAPHLTRTTLLAVWLSTDFGMYRECFERYFNLATMDGEEQVLLQVLDICNRVLDVSDVKSVRPLKRQMYGFAQSRELPLSPKVVKTFKLAVQQRLTTMQSIYLWLTTFNG